MKRLFKSILVTLCMVISLGTAAFAEETVDVKAVPVTEYGQVVDTFQGIDACYIPGLYNSDYGDFCCAGYVIKFYKELYGVDTYYVNMVCGKPTVVKEGHDVYLEEVDVPMPGDMMQNLSYSHVGIVKRVEGDKVILIEQNYKWSEDGQTVGAFEREISLSDAHFYRLVIDGEEMVYPEVQERVITEASDLWNQEVLGLSNQDLNIDETR